MLYVYFSTCLHGILKGASQEEEGCRMLEPLLPQQREGVFQGCLPPPVLVEVVAEEVCHFGILLGPEEKESDYGWETETAVWWVILGDRQGQIPVQSPDHCLLLHCEVK